MAFVGQYYEHPAPQPVQDPVEENSPTLLQGIVQDFEGYLNRQSRILKRWKKEWLKVEPGNLKDFSVIVVT